MTVLQGIAVLIELLKWLKTFDTFYSYRLVIGPEHLGTIFYLRDLPNSERKIWYQVFLKKCLERMEHLR